MIRDPDDSFAAATTGTFGTRLEDLDWIDGFAANVRSYVRVRLEDGVLIKMPTEVFKVNDSGLRLLQRVLQGEAARDVARSCDVVEHPERIYQMHTFFCDVRDLLSRRLGDGRGRVSTISAPFTRSFTKYPVLSELALTYRCNQACKFCYAGCGSPDATPGNAAKEKHRRRWPLGSDRRRKKRKQELSTAEARDVIDQIAGPGKCPSISFTGGECTLRPDLPELIRHARERGLRVNLITNALRCSDADYARRLVDAGLTSAQVSLEGPNAAVHDALAQRAGSFELAVRGLVNLRDCGLTVHTNTTICEQNADHLTPMVDLAKSLGLPRLSMNHVIPTGTPKLPRHEWIRMPYTRIGHYVLQVKEHALRLGIDFHWYSPTPFCIFNPVAHGLGNKGCAACDGLLHVSPTGDVLPCSSFAQGVGNLLEQSFEDIWFARDAQYYKKKHYAHPLCRMCPDFALCQGACTLYWSAMGYGELYTALRSKMVGVLRPFNPPPFQGGDGGGSKGSARQFVTMRLHPPPTPPSKREGGLGILTRSCNRQTHTENGSSERAYSKTRGHSR